MKMNLMKTKKKKGFTLIELIVVIAIIGILAAIAVPKFSKFTETAKDQADKVSATTIKDAFALDRSNGVFNNTADVTVTINHTGVATVGDDINLDDATVGLTDAVADNIVLKAIDALVLQGGKKIEIKIGANDGAITSTLK